MLRILSLTLLLFSSILAQDEFLNLGTYSPNYFSEFLDTEIYTQDTIMAFGVGGLVFLDVTESNNPRLIGRYDPGNVFTKRFYNVKAEEKLAIASARKAGLYLINLEELNNPALISIHQHSVFNYESADFRDFYAYAAIHENGIEIIDISDFQTPITIRVLEESSDAWDVFIKNDLLYVADGLAGLKIYSIQNPFQPELISSLITTGPAREIYVENDLAYIALGTSGFDIIDVSDPFNPKNVSNFKSKFGILNHLAVDNNIVFAATWELVIAVDVSIPTQPKLIATEDTPARAMGIAAKDGKVFVSDWFNIQTYKFASHVQPDIHVKPSAIDIGFKGVNNSLSKNSLCKTSDK